MRFSEIARGLLAGGALFAASSASAVPVPYLFQSGDITITATVLGTTVAGPVTIPLNGVSVTVDEGTLTVNSILFTSGTTGSIPISPAFFGYTSINLDFASISATAGTLSLVDLGPPAEYGFDTPLVTVAGQFDAINTNPIFNITNAPFSFSNFSASGTIFVNGTSQLELNGITLGQIDTDGAGPRPPLVLKGDITFTGVPEPGTALLLGLGIAGLAGVRRSRRA